MSFLHLLLTFMYNWERKVRIKTLILVMDSQMMGGKDKRKNKRIQMEIFIYLYLS